MKDLLAAILDDVPAEPDLGDYAWLGLMVPLFLTTLVLVVPAAALGWLVHRACRILCPRYSNG